MGANQSSATSPDFNPKQWQITDRQSSQNDLKGNYKVLQNFHTGQLIDQYQLFWPSEEDFRFYLDSYLWRRQQYNIVASRFIVEQHSQKFCSRSYSAKVYIEHIPTRLSDVTDIPYPDNLYVGLAMMDGYQKLYQNVHHYFPVAEDQICVDRQGVVKVWVNSDLSKNYPQPENELTDNKDESNMVDQLLNLLWENTDEQSQPVSFQQFDIFNNKDNSTSKRRVRRELDSTKLKLSSTSMLSNQICQQKYRSVTCQIPQRFNSILHMIDQSEDQYQHTNNEDQRLDSLEQEEMQGYNQQIIRRGYDEKEQREERLYDEQRPNDEQYHHQYMGQLSYGLENAYIAPQQNVSYNQGPVQNLPIPIPSPQILNPQFIPRQITPSDGHIITIPPIKGRYGLTQIPIIIPQQSSIYKPSLPQSNNHFKNIFDQLQQQTPIKIQQLNNRNQQVEGDIQELKSDNNGENSNVEILMGTNRKEINTNYPVGKSLQFPNQPRESTTRTNKSQINQKQGQQSSQVSYSRGHFGQYQTQRFTGSQEPSRQYDLQRYQQNENDEFETKYYTIDTEVDLDEEIAADLRKMIRAG